MIIERFKQQVEKHPHKLAVKTEKGAFTYHELNRFSNRIANEVKEGSGCIGVLMEDPWDMIAAILGTLRAGHVYVPLAGDLPVKRLEYIARHAGITVLITDNKNKEWLQQVLCDVSLIIVEELDQQKGHLDFTRKVCKDRGASLLYTSGSTGFPKGVRQYHRNILYYIERYTETFDITCEDNLTLLASFAHDVTLLDMYSALLNGAALFPLDLKKDGVFSSLPRWLRNENITIWHSVPTVFRYFASGLTGRLDLPRLRYVVVGGEAASRADIEKFNTFFSGCQLYVLYGQTESSYNSGQFFTAGEPVSDITLGNVNKGTQMFVVDDEGDEVDALEVGEIIVVGQHLSPGYWQDEKKTAERFFEAPSPEEGRVYFSGDLGRCLMDGRIEFVGRKDYQVKLRGYRIELEEIEKVMLQYPNITQAAVTAVETPSSKERFLAGYFAAPMNIDMKELREFLREHLFDYMIPSYLKQMEKLPVTVSGKIDRNALPQPEIALETEYVAPTGEMEKNLVEIWAEVLNLGKEVIGVKSDFFQLGGHSLKATVLTAQVHAKLQVKLPLAVVFERPTISELAQYIEQTGETTHVPIWPVEKKEYYPLSSVQRRIYFLQQLDREGTGYNIPFLFNMGDYADREKLEYTCKQMIQRHEILRTSFEIIDQGPVQRVHDHPDFQMEYYEAAPEEAEDYFTTFIRPFDLSKAPLFRGGLLRVNGQYTIMFDFHHIIVDNTSLNTLEADYLALYDGKELPGTLQYKDYSQWQDSPQQRVEKERQEDYWLQAFEGELPILDLPYDFPRPPVQRFEGRILGSILEVEETRRLRKMAREFDTTLFMILFSAFNVLLSRLSLQEEIIVGTPIAARRHADLQDMVGMFVNTLPLRNRLSGAMSFVDFLKAVKQNALTAYENQEYPFEELVEKVAVQRDTSRNPIFDVMFSLVDETAYQFEVSDESEQQALIYRKTGSKFDLNLTAVDRGPKMVFRFEYSTSLFKESTIERITGYYNRILSVISEDPTVVLSHIDMMSEQEKEKILQMSNGTEERYDLSKTIHRVFEEQADRFPDKVGVEGPAGGLAPLSSGFVTYNQLNENTNQLAHLLREKGVTPGAIAAVLMERSIEKIIGILGILKASGAYLPIDPAYPEERISYMLEDSGAKVLLTNLPEGHHLFNCQLSIVNYQLSMSFETQSTTRDSQPATRLAYVIYTSGSTGKPKGVMVDHRSCLNILTAMQKEYPLKEADTYLLKTSYVFDVSVAELFGWFWEGGRLAVLAKDAEKDPGKLVEAIERYCVTHLNFVPSMFGPFVEFLDYQNIHCLSTLKYIFLAGEALLAPAVKAFNLFQTNTRLENIYGPTEATIYTSYYSLKDWDGADRIPIGRPLPNIKIYILDLYGHLQPTAVAGELCIGGHGVARGYLNQPELTNSKFQRGWSPLRFSASQLLSFSLYRTGDLARWLPDPAARGTYIIEFLGRIDHQVKIRGFRIELGEVESQLLNHPGIKEVVVTKNKGLCAYFAADTEFTAAQLREHLSRTLPDYMIPAYFVKLDRLPLTGSGKINRKALPLPGERALASGAPYAPPRNPVEQKLVETWQKVLGRSVVGINDNFFEIGGDSIKTIQIAARMHKAGYRIEMKDIFRNPRIAQLAPLVKKIEPAAVPSPIFESAPFIPIRKEFFENHPIEVKEVQDIYPLTPMQEGMLFYAVYDRKGRSSYFQQMSYRLQGHLDIECVEKSLNVLFKRHDVLRTAIIYQGLDRPLQVVLKERKPEIYFEDLRDSINYSDDRDRIVREFNEKDRERFFDLGKDVLMRAAVLQLGETEYQITWSFHHILMDGWCVGILISEFFEIYMSFITDQSFQLPEVKPFRRYIEWLEKQDKEVSRNYWKKYLEGYEEIAALPGSRNLYAFEVGYKSGVVSTVLEDENAAKLIRMAICNHVTLNTVLQAVWGVVLGKYSGKPDKDSIFGVVVSGRPAEIEGIEAMIGCFINTIPLRIEFDDNTSFNLLIRKVQEKAIECEPHHYYPLADIQAESVLKQNLLDHIMEFQNYPLAEQIEGIGRRDSEYDDHHQMEPLLLSDAGMFEQSTYDFNITVVPREQVSMAFSYNVNVYEQELVERIGGHCMRVIEQILEDEGITIGEITLLSEEEKQQILFEFNDNQADFSKDKTVHQWLEKHVEKTPNRIAVVSETQHLTYRQLNISANRLARVLGHCGIGADDPVGILMERSQRMMECITAVWKAGACYIPINTAYPSQRLIEILKDSGAKVLLTRKMHVSARLGEEYEGKIVNVDSIPAESHVNPEVNTSMSSLAYVIYTSGSTGIPKGAMVEHIGMMNHIQAKINDLRLNEGSIIAQNASHTFDISVWQFFAALMPGGKTIIYPNEIILEPDRFLSQVVKDRVTILEVVPSYLSVMLDSPDTVGAWHALPRSLDYLLVTGEEVKPDLVRKWFDICPGIPVVNAYGPTEASDDITHYRMDKAPAADIQRIPIGKPLQNLNIYIVDHQMQLCPIGVKGEICVSGVGVGRGYLKDDERTKEVFMEDPFIEERGVRLYKTGDLGSWLSNGTIEFFGRKDYQVKIRGFRIELGEIENCLLKHPAVKEAAVVDKADEAGNKFLCAYVVHRSSELPELKEFLSESLPDYMIPSYIMQMETIPLTPNGKMDRKALPMPEGIGDLLEYIPPGNPLEEKLVEIWAEVLKVEKGMIGVYHNFFDLGGHSLKATVLISLIHRELEVKVPLAELFKRPFIRELAEYIKYSGANKYAGIEPVEKREYYAMSSAQKRLYFIQQMDPNSTSYNMPLVLPIGKDIDKDKIEFTLKKLITRHESLRTSFIVVDEVPYQKIYENAAFEIEYYKEDYVEVLRAIIEEFIRPFDLSCAPLMRSGLIRLPDGQHIWMVDIHHIVSDGTSHTVLAEDLIALYNGEPLEPLRIQYKDFSQWQNRLFESGEIKTQEDYWLELYKGDIPRLQMPEDYKRPEVFTFAGDRYRFKLDTGDAVKFRALDSRNGGTLYMNILAVLNVLFYRYTGQTDIIIGTGIAGRPHADLQAIIGMFINTLAMRNQPEGEKTYETFLKEVIAHSLEAFENQDLQFEELVDKLDLQRDASRNPLFDMMMVVQNFRRVGEGGSAQEEVDPVQVEQVPVADENLSNLDIGYKNITSKFDMTFFVREGGEGGEDVYISIEYYTAVFKQETIARFVRHFEKVIKEVVSNPKVQLKDIDILWEEEKETLLYQFNDTETAYPREKTIGELFEEQVEQTPDFIALVGPVEQHVTYKKLDEKSNQLANYLHYENGMVPDQPVGLLIDRSLFMIIAIFGIIKAGGAYVPMSPSFPEERIKTMINDAGIRVLIGQKQYIRTLNRLQWENKQLDAFLCMDSENVYAEDEREESELMSRKLWEFVAETSVDEITGGGWNSSYTGNPIPKIEMDEYGNNVLKKLEPLLHKEMRVLEIGAASGISMYRIAPKVGFYYGTDISEGIIKKNMERIKEEGHRNIKVRRLAAHEIDQLEEREFDVVILNSVIQCFNGHNYLRKTIRKAIDLVGNKGYIFIGDIMDQDLKEDLIADLVAFRLANKGKNYKTKIDWSEELFISRFFLEDLGLDYPEIRDVKFSNKIYTIKNELTRFRYDALLHIEKKGKAAGKRNKRNKNQHDLRTLRKYDTGKLMVEVHSDNLAYIIYTSGSTGVPKGTLTTHCNVTRVVRDTNYIDFQPGDRILQLSDYAFDGSIFDIYGALLNGLPLVLAGREDLLEIEALSSLAERESITVFFVTTALFNTLVDVGLESLSGVRKILFGGERVSVTHAKKALEYLGKGRLLHMYGPTETTVYATWYPIDEIEDNQITIPIGSPISNTWIYILDSCSRPVPMGVNGEIYIGGPGVCKGYLNNPELTNSNFQIPNYKIPAGAPLRFSASQLLRFSLYRTGDLARWLPYGAIEFSGRIDHQVKVRGFRIELGEIESRLMGYAWIKECSVTAREDEKGSRYLCAYVVLKDDETLDTADLKDHLSRVLPDFMVPSYYIQMETFPLASTGKIDRSKLPNPLLGADGSITAARDEIEEKMVEVWSEVLGIGREMIGIDANFFELGGHSLKATVLTSKLHKELMVKVPLAEVFNRQTVRALSQYIRDASAHRYAAIEKAEEKEYYALSAAQKRLYVIQQMELESTRYNMFYMFPVGKDINKERLESTFRKLIQRHESFRTSFFMLNEQPVQKIHDHVEFEIKFFDTFGKPFDLSQAPLLKVGFAASESETEMLVVEMHHIISDGTSQGILDREFAALYAGEELEPLQLQYKDYSEWQNSEEQQALMENQEKYWLREFAGELPVLSLPLDFPRPLLQSVEGRRLSFFIDKEMTGMLKALGKKTDATLYMVLLSIYNILLAKLSGQEDLIVGTPIAGRRHADLQHIIGMFVNTLSLRNYPEGRKGFLEFLKEVKERTIEAYENQEYQFEDLVDKVAVRRDTSRNPLFDVMFNFLNQADYFGNIGEADLDLIEDRGKSKANFDMTFQGSEVDGVIYLTVEYCTTLFKEETIKRFIRYFKKILTEIKKDPNRKLFSIEIISEAEKKQLLFDFNDTDAEYPADKTIHQLFEEQVPCIPDHIAVAAHFTGYRSYKTYMTYTELNETSNQLSHRLMEKGVKSGSIVAIMMERSAEMVIGILGILKSGGAYLPINPAYPLERMQDLLKDSNAKILLTNLTEDRQSFNCQLSIVSYQLLMSLSKAPLHHSSFIDHHSGNLAYIIYTSGSTGKPKGVLVEHRGVVRLVKNINYIEFMENDRILQTGALEFDASTFEIWGPLLNGLELHLAPKDVLLTPGRLKGIVCNSRISIMWMTSPLFNQVVDEDIGIFQGLRCLLVGGDVVSPVHINRVRQRYPDLNIINGYGPTENTTFSTTFRIDREYTQNIPIGTPITNSTAYILDKYNNLQPIGVAGELYVGGDGLARGYLNNPELTIGKFPPAGAPLSFSASQFLSFSLYRTGDLARWLSSGDIEFLGRMDEQVKIRGFRIEPGEIESRLITHGDIKEVVVTALNGGAEALCAYFVADKELSAVELKTYLSKYLPDYMIPSFFVQIDRVPLTSNKKVDRRALPSPVIKASGEYAAPRNALEKTLARLWVEVLGMEATVGIDDNFFEIGGHSLKATILISKIHKSLDVQLPLLEIFKAPTIRGLAQCISGAVKARHESITPAEEKEYYALSSAQKRMYILQQMNLYNTAYNMPQFFPFPERPDIQKLTEIFKTLIGRHESLRTSFHMINNQPMQKVHDTVEFAIEYQNAQSVQPFDLSQAPLLRVGLIMTGENETILSVDMHHIISDGISHNVLLKDFIALYIGEDLPLLTIQYRDYAEWQNREKEKETLKQQKAYWLRQFEGEVPVLDLPTDYDRPKVQWFEGSTVPFDINREMTASLKKVALEKGATLYMVLLTIYSVFLAKMSGQEDIVVGTPIAGRRHSDLDRIIGMFVNTLALRNKPAGEKTFEEFLKEVIENTLEAFENQEYPFEDLVENAAVTRDAGRNPLFDVMLVLQNIDMNMTDTTPPDTGEGASRHHVFENETAKFDLMLNSAERNGHLVFSLGYSTNLFKKETIERYIKYLHAILLAVLNDRNIKISEIDILPEEERQQILYDFNDTKAEYPEDKALHELFEEQAERVPDGIAIHRTYRTYMTYKQLNKTSNQLVRLLKEKGVKADVIVGIMMERSIEMVVGMLGILKAGGAYLPIDPAYPEERSMYMLKDSGAKVLLTDLPEGHHLFNCQLSIVNCQLLMINPATRNPQPAASSSNLAYVIYTSGSTGHPKGVMVKHGNAVNVVKWFGRTYQLQGDTHVLLMSEYTFDPSVNQVFGTLLHGAVLYIVDKELLVNVEGLRNYIEQHRVNILNFVPMFLNELLGCGEKLKSVRAVLCGGERLDEAIKENIIKKGYALYNQYGPTETTIDALVGRCSQEKVTLGKPIDNAVCYIFDKYTHLVPVGVVGELYIGGDGVSRGYLNNPEQAAEKFFSSSLLRFSASQLLSFSLYRTGDLARWLHNGNIEFLGRMDEQVKIRGFRVEPGEIENRLLRHPGVKEAVVVTREKETGDNYLCAYIVPVNIEKAAAEEFREYLSHSLPDYMVPSYFVIIENIPLTSHGKVDRKALPIPELESRSQYIAPGDRVEVVLAEIWGEILGVEKEKIGIDHHFFELGGHSLKATVMIARVHKELHVRVPLAEVFKAPTIRGLAEYIKASVEDRHAAIQPVEKMEYYELSSAQKRLYILQQMDLNGTAYNIPKMIPLEETPDFSYEQERMENTFKKLITRHESLRTSFHMINNQPVQRIHDHVEFSMEQGAWSVEQRARDRDSLHAPCSMPHASVVHPFDLSRAPLLRVGLIKLEEKRYLLWVDMHHIISDGASHSVLIQDFVSLYQGEAPPPLRIQYKDFAYWQNSDKERAAIQRQELYWLNQFAGEIPVLDIPTDYPRPAVQSFDGSSVSFQVSPHHTAALRAIAMEKGTAATMYMVLLALSNILLAKLSSQEDIIIGTPVAGRRHADLECIIGMFVNTLALRNQPAGEKTFASFLLEVKEKTLQAFENQEYPFEDLVDRVTVNRDAGRNPLFDVMLVFQDAGDTQTTPYEDEMHHYENTIAKFDITLSAVEVGEGLRFAFSYCSKLFKQETIERFINYFKKIISSVIADPNQPISEIEIVSEEEKHRLLYDFNQRDTEYPADKTLHQLFEEQVLRAPDGIAIHIPHRTYMTYDQLNRKSNQLAHYLHQQGAKANHLVGIMADRSLEMIVGILGILKAGCGYVPLDPKAPEARTKYILEGCNARVLLKTETNTNDQNKINTPIVLNFENLNFGIVSDFEFRASNFNPLGFAYVIYTSGSTGKPKGVPITHANLSPLLHWGYRHLGLNVDDRIIQNLAYYFDWSVWEIFITLTSGAGLCMVSEDLLLNPEASIAFINENGITVLHVTPSQYRYYLAVGRKLETLRYLFIGAEALSVDLVKRSFDSVRDHCRVFNMYGPTETTIIASALEINRADVDKFKGLSSVPIGRPVANTDFLILDKYLKLCPVNVTGELYIGGEGLSPGYLNNPELTAEKFNRSYKSYRTYISYYKTGDLARWLPDGNVKFLGRTDLQVKVRGYRIELGEIESQLLKHPEVKEAVVLAGTKESSDKYLCAYIVPHSTHSPNLKEYLSHSLPDYMIPSYFIEIERIPVTPNGKIDRKALPAPEIVVEEGYTAPRHKMEEKLVSIWSEVLEIEKEIIGIDDDFFQRGGHSLKATLLVSRIREELGVVVPLVQVFKTPTIRQLAVYIKEASKEINTIKDEHLVLLKKTSAAAGHLFFIHDGTGEVEGYIEFCNHLHSEINCWGIRASKPETIEALAETYIERMKKIQPRGPYFIAGWSIGGTIAYEMARQLEVAGEAVGFLALIDTAPPMPVKKRVSTNINTALQQLLDHSIITPLNIETVQALEKARNKYDPEGKINAAGHYFSATDSRVPNKNQWTGYFEGKLEFHPVKGDHFSIFKMPEVTAFAKMFDDVLVNGVGN